MAGTAIQITCYDRDGKEVKRVTSTDSGDIEEDTGNSYVVDQPSNNGAPTGGVVPGEGD